MGCLKLPYDENQSPLYVSANNFGGNSERGLECNHFELRMYDPLIGRWLQVDPYGQYASSYLGMGNNPINRVDPDGGFDNVYQRQADGSLKQVGTQGGDHTHYILDQAGNLELTMLSEITVYGNGIQAAVYRGQDEFINNSLTRSMAVLTASILSGPGGWAAYGKSFGFNMIKNSGDWQASMEGVDAAGLLFGKVDKVLPSETKGILVDGAKNALNNFVDFNGESGVTLKVNSKAEILDAASKTLVHTGIDAVTRGQKGVLGDQIPTQVNDVAKRIMGGDGFDQ
ncbi:MAG: RHS repeat-associated core domain-containing protein [Bacteroidota bacterium]